MIIEYPLSSVSRQTCWAILLFAVDDQQPEVKAEQAPAPIKKEAPIVAETKVLDGAAPPATSGKKKNSAKKQKTEPGNDDTVVQDHISAFLHSQTEAWTCTAFFSNPVDEAHVLVDSTAAANHQAAHNDDAPSKEKGKKQKNETDKGKGDPVFGFFLHNQLLSLTFTPPVRCDINREHWGEAEGAAVRSVQLGSVGSWGR